MHAREGPGGPPVLVGRDSELARLTALAEHAGAGHGGLAVIEGEPGIGKSTLLAAITARLGRRGVRVQAGAAEELDQRIPFSAIGNCWADSGDAAEVGQLLRGLGTGSAEYTEYAALQRVLALVERWCAGSPVALVLDDLQWADPATLIALSRLIRVAPQLPLLLVLAHRPIGPGDDVSRLLRNAPPAGRIRLDPLASEAVACLVERILHARPDPALLDVLSVAAGNPLYVSALTESLVRENRIVLGDDTATVTGEISELPSSLMATITRQLDFLSIHTRKVLQAAALIGPTFDATELATMLGMPPLELLDVIEGVVHTGLIRSDGPQLAFRHEVIRRTLHDELVPSMRAALHLQAGHALAAAGAPSERVASHLVSAGLLGTETVQWLAGVAGTLTVRAPELAVALLARATERMNATDPKRTRLLVAYARALLFTGEQERAISIAREAIPDIGEAAAECELRWVLVQANWRLGRLQHAAEEARTAERVAATVTQDWADRFHGLVAECLFLSGQIDKAETVAQEVLDTASDLRGLSYARQVLCMTRLNRGQAGDAVELAERLIDDIGREGGTPDLQIAPHIPAARTYLQLDRLADAEKMFERGRLLEERHGGMHLGVHHTGKALVMFWQGRWDDTLAELAASADVVDNLGLNQLNAALPELIRVHRQGQGSGEVEEPNATVGGFYYLLFRSWGDALGREAREDREEALEILTDAIDRLSRKYGSYDRFWLYPDLARLAARCGRTDLIDALLDDLRSRAGVPSVAGTTALCSAIAKSDAAAAGLAADLFRKAQRPLFEAYAHEQAAVLFAQAEHITAARTHFGKARRLFARMDAAWDIGRAESRLRQAGIQAGVSGPRQRPKSGWAALTNAERKIAALVGEGRSNPDIAARLVLSRRTVQAHVSSIFTKLGLSTRVELAVLVAARNSDSS